MVLDTWGWTEYQKEWGETGVTGSGTNENLVGDNFSLKDAPSALSTAFGDECSFISEQS